MTPGIYHTALESVVWGAGYYEKARLPINIYRKISGLTVLMLRSLNIFFLEFIRGMNVTMALMGNLSN